VVVIIAIIEVLLKYSKLSTSSFLIPHLCFVESRAKFRSAVFTIISAIANDEVAAGEGEVSELAYQCDSDGKVLCTI
jgi:hypothetical protein